MSSKPKSPDVFRLVNGYSSMLSMGSSAYLLRLPDANVLIDNGERAGREELLAGLRQRGMAPGDIDVMAYTHLHMDHCWNHQLFTKARAYFTPLEEQRIRQGMEVMQLEPEKAEQIVQAYLGLDHPVPSRLFKLNLEFFIREAVPDLILQSARIDESGLEQLGVRCLPTPGHTAGHTSFVWQDGECRYVFAGDAVFNRAAFRQSEDRMVYNENKEQSRASKRMLEQQQGWICPGHDLEFYADPQTRGAQ